MKKVIFKGPVLTQSGYGVHARQVARWLLSKNDIDVKFVVTPWGDTPWILNRSHCDGLVGKIMERTASPDYKADVSFQLQLPNEWDSKLCPINIGITAAVETDLANPDWVADSNKMSCIVLPSNHSLKSLENAGTLTVESHVIPESFSDDIVKNDDKTIDLSHVKTSFNFLLFGQMTGNNPFNDRKNLLFTIKWICEVFEKDNDVGIIIKTNAGRNTKIDRNIVLRNLEVLLKEVRPRSENPKVYLLHGDMSDSDVAALYKHQKVKALVSLTRGEGYGLPILEAAAAGLPVIATGWSGHLDFMKHTKFVSIDHKLTQIHPSRVDDKIFMKNSKWAEPIEEDFKKKITKFRNSSSTPREWATQGANKIHELYSHDAVSKIYDEKLSKFLVNS
jgi:glycosyltransferase involved in cell wall biosynthesis